MKVSGWIGTWRFWSLIPGALLVTFPAYAAETFQDVRVQDARATKARFRNVRNSCPL